MSISITLHSRLVDGLISRIENIPDDLPCTVSAVERKAVGDQYNRVAAFVEAVNGTRDTKINLVRDTYSFFKEDTCQQVQ